MVGQGPHPSQPAGPTEGEAADQQFDALRMAVQSFEAFFLQYLLQSMRSTIPETGLMGGGFAIDTYQGMLDQAMADEMATAGGIGIGDLLFEQLRPHVWTA